VALPHASRARILFASDPGVSLRSTPGFMLPPTSRAWKLICEITNAVMPAASELATVLLAQKLSDWSR
jgi:hypothetical protein